MTHSEQPNIERIETDTQEAIKSGEDIARHVHDITVRALTEGKLDAERIKGVTNAVIEGVRKAAPGDSERQRETWAQVFEGLDHAFDKAAQASRLALQEAAGRAGEFAGSDLKHMLAEFEQLESLFIDILRDAAKSSQKTTAEILGDLIEHAQRSGTAVGEQVGGTLGALREQLARTSDEAMQAARTAGVSLAQMASGMLAGLADALKSGPGTGGESKH